jgi:hypothetical protein
VPGAPRVAAFDRFSGRLRPAGATTGGLHLTVLDSDPREPCTDYKRHLTLSYNVHPVTACHPPAFFTFPVT